MSEEAEAKDFFDSIGIEVEKATEEGAKEADAPVEVKEEAASETPANPPDQSKAEESFYHRLHARKVKMDDLSRQEQLIQQQGAAIQQREQYVEAILQGIATNQQQQSETNPFEEMDEETQKLEEMKSRLAQLEDQANYSQEVANQQYAQQEDNNWIQAQEQEWANEVQQVEAEWGHENPQYWEEVKALKIGLAQDMDFQGTPRAEIASEVMGVLRGMAKQAYRRNIHPCKLISYHAQKFKHLLPENQQEVAVPPVVQGKPKQKRTASARKNLAAEQKAVEDGAAGSLSQTGRVQSSKTQDDLTLDQIMDSGLSPGQVKDIFSMGGKNAFLKVAAAAENATG